jgi:hypothetical protein
MAGYASVPQPGLDADMMSLILAQQSSIEEAEWLPAY